MLDWGGSGPPLIFVHGITDNPHAFDDLAPAFTDRHRVVAYARRGHGGSQAQAPYDTGTLTQDLRGLMDALGIDRAHLVGWSMGGNEATRLAGESPDRVLGIVYLDGAYDWSDYGEAFAALPTELIETPPGIMRSMDAYLSHKMAVDHPRVDHLRRIEAYLRESVTARDDGSLQPRTPDAAANDLFTALLTDRRNYTQVRAPILALYAESMFDLNGGDERRRALAQAWEQTHVVPFRRASIERVRRELPQAEIIEIRGAHGDFFVTCREQVVRAMCRFLAA